MAALMLVSALLGVLAAVQAHTYHLGGCPTVDPMPNFDMAKFLGKWYVLEKTSTNVRCLTNEYSAPGNGPARLKQTMMLGLPGVTHVVRYTGILTVPDSTQPARMDVKFPLNVAGSSSYTVFMTDYDSYAAAYTCQKLALWYRHSAAILSRNITLDPAIKEQIHGRLRQLRVDTGDLDAIRHDCAEPSEDGVHVDIRPYVFKSTNLTEVLDSANTAINEVADVARSVHDVYSQVSGVYNAVSGGARRRRDVEREMDWIP